MQREDIPGRKGSSRRFSDNVVTIASAASVGACGEATTISARPRPQDLHQPVFIYGGRNSLTAPMLSAAGIVEGHAL